MRRITFLAAGAQAQAGEDEVVRDHWFAQFQGGRKTGWAHERCVRSRGTVTPF